MLTTAPASSVFRCGPGSRYLVLTAYRIQTLQHICFVYLLQNIHEVIWSEESHLDLLKRSKNNVSFEAAAWWSPSWAEKTRITRALWKVMIYWNIQAICPTVMDDCGFSRYRENIQHISPCIGPDLPRVNGEDSYREVEEMTCILTATHDLLDHPYEPFTPFTSHQTYHKFRIKEWTSSTIFKETLNWKFEESKPLTGNDARKYGPHHSSVNDINRSWRSLHWRHWPEKLYGCTALKSIRYNPLFLDYLGLCIWDNRRHGFFGLAPLYEKFPREYSGLSETPSTFLIRLRYILDGQSTYARGHQII